MTMPKTLRLILGDQLNALHSWFSEINPEITYVMMECRSETDYAPHHIQKVVGFFSAMRCFREFLHEKGHSVIYYHINDESNKQGIVENVSYLLNIGEFERFEYQLPDEWRLDEALRSFCDSINIETKAFDSEHFYTTRYTLKEMFVGKKQILMERFYQQMRKEHGILMIGDKPITGQWNHDASNRKKLPKNWVVPPPLRFKHDVTELVEEIKLSGAKTIGHIESNAFIWPINREESLQLLKFFLEEMLEHFGDFQDAMNQENWSLYHARISFSMNLKMLSPGEVVDAAVAHWANHQEKISFSQIEGFVRQIIGWREFMRGIYWWKMPEFSNLNYFEHNNRLPQWYWNGNTKMACLKSAISGSLHNAYAHHIQRLMVTGNFALLAGCDPQYVDEWYLGIYIDAIEWVEITNTRGMSQFADGGIVGTKPYVSGGSYINKMGDHCTSCHYKHDVKTGEKACPLNSLYWHFHHRHRSKLENNPRIGMMYRTWDKMSDEKQKAYLEQAEKYLSEVDYI